MILLEIKKFKKSYPVKWKSDSISDLAEGQIMLRFAGEHPDNPEHGSVEILTTLVEGSFSDIEEILFVGDDATSGRLLSMRRGLFGGYIIAVDFNTIYAHGLEYCTRNFIFSGGAIIGLSKKDKASLINIDGQKNLLALLAGYIIPTKKELIINLAKPCLLLLPNESNNEDSSHFLGAPILNSLPFPESLNGIRLFHLATLFLDELPSLVDNSKMKNVLSFYINIKDTEKGWPEGSGDFKILNYDLVEKSKNITPLDYDSAVNFDYKLLLDLPAQDHSCIRILNFTKDELIRYRALNSVYIQLVIDNIDENEFDKIWGYPNNVQHCVAFEAERMYNKRDYNDDLYQEATQWQLILQISPYCHWFKFFDEFGDGTIYYMIRQKDLENGDFNNVQVIVQNT